MKPKIVIKIIAIIEVLIGSVTFLGLITSLLLSVSGKPLNVFIFVLASSLVSILIGLGLLGHKKPARKLLIFFSGYVILTKILVFSNLLYFRGEIVTVISTDLKNTVSILYHGFVMLFFNRETVKKYFN